MRLQHTPGFKVSVKNMKNNNTFYVGHMLKIQSGCIGLNQIFKFINLFLFYFVNVATRTF